jgi:ribosomal protein L11 methyltransferase
VNGQPTEWFSIEITADSSAVEALEFLFNELGSLGTEVQQFHKKESDPFTVIGYFEKLPDEEWFDARLSDSLQVYGLPSKAIKLIERKTIEKTDWLAEWKKHWRPVQIGRFLIAPEWEELSNVDPNLIVIRIEPNMAFGTGTHETTQLCLKAIDEYFDAGMSFLDVGTGTGILAIAGVKKSDDIRSRVLAIDIDPDPIDIASKNAKRNSVYEKIEFRCDELTDDTPSFDFVCANLTLDAILPFLPRLLAKSKRILVLSGILAEQRKQLTAELNRFSIVNADIRQDGEWIAAVIRR